MLAGEPTEHFRKNTTPRWPLSGGRRARPSRAAPPSHARQLALLLRHPPSRLVSTPCYSRRSIHLSLLVSRRPARLPCAFGLGLVPRPVSPEPPEDRDALVILDRYELVVPQLLLPCLFVLRGGPHVQATAEIRVGVHVVKVAIALPGDELSRRRERL